MSRPFDSLGSAAFRRCLLIVTLMCLFAACAANSEDEDDAEKPGPDADDDSAGETVYEDPEPGWSVVRVNDTVEIRLGARILYTLVGAETLT
ncbi:MAG: hypothetical protein KJ042_14265, partial [Deltaproteobacteria bacterium]|nr:hypothetical protein [Deltaproteobacteria bacterium]